MRFGWFFALPLLFVALLAGSCGYAMGVGSSAASHRWPRPAVYPMWGFGWFFPFFGFIFFLIVIFAIVGAFKRRVCGLRNAQRIWTRCGYGHGPGRGWPSPSTPRTHSSRSGIAGCTVSRPSHRAPTFLTTH